ncbi:MAG: helix-turn-helix transcriptional regulator [Phycisphaerae bacterium]|nr:helix-turn-helix transcriptional regulator [Phycisphaerae bacterium]
MYNFVFMWEFQDTLRTKVFIADVGHVRPDWGGGTGHCDTYGRLYWLTTGRASVEHHNRQWHLQKGHLHVIPANVPYRLHCPHRATIEYVHFTAVLWGNLDLFEFLGGPYDLKPDRLEKVRNQVRRLREVFQNGPSDSLEIPGLLLQLLAPFQAAGEPHERRERTRDIRRFESVFQCIEAGLHHPLRLADLARKANLEPTYFSHVFAKRFGLSPIRYVLRRRVERARDILWNTDATLEATARQLGFTDAFHLSRTFKSITGMSPRQFRQQNRIRVP